jgi:hypothetical protein
LTFDDRVEVAQALAHGPRHFRVGEVVEDGLVVFIDQDDRALPVFFRCPFDQFAKATRNARVLALHA